MQYIDHYASPLGGITLASDGESLTGLWFDGQKHFARTLDPDHKKASLPVFDQTRLWLNAYFSGRAPGLMPPLKPQGTPFQKEVWSALLKIPYGKTASYGTVAVQIAENRCAGKTSARAVGSAVGRNPVSLIIPCHRVVGADGSLTGYAGGTARKRALLALEKADSLPSLLK